MIQRFHGPATNSLLQQYAPAIFAQAPHQRVSSKYSFLRTIDVIDALRNHGWQPFAAGESRVKDITRQGVQRHVVRFRHGEMTLKNVGDVVPELVLLNSHDATGAYQLHAGLFRLVCSNGTVVADSTFAKVSIRHSNTALQDVIDASFSVVQEVPKIAESVEAMRAVILTPEEQLIFAESAAKLRWDEDKIPVQPVALNRVRRYEDQSADLWTTYNRVQENLVRGGIRGVGTTGRRLHTRSVASIGEDTKINKALWHLTEEMRKLKTL